MTLVRLRWLAVAGQGAAVLGVYFGLGFELPLAPCLVLIALSAALNLYLRIGYTGSVRLASRHAALLLGYDICQLACLLYLTGGLENPFTFLLLVPVTVSATSLPLRLTLVLAVLVVGAASLLTFFHAPLPWFAAAPVRLPDLYVTGVYFSLLCCLAFLGIYARRIAEEARQMADALAATELVLAREQQLTALDGLAAAAAHELGTPLGTISIVTKELLRATAPDDPAAEDIRLLKTQVDRCRDILTKLTSLRDTPDALFARMPLSSLIEDVIAPHRDFGVEIRKELPAAGSNGGEPVGRRSAAIIYSLGNLVENAVDFAETQVVVRATWDDNKVQIEIADDGPGFSHEVLNRLGEPYVTSRGIKRGKGDEGDFGLGLGFFIAKTLLERSGATLQLTNRQPPDRGATVTVTWPRSTMDVGEDTAMAAS
jgi:two-component system sensor histidine kinase RegB